MNKIFFIFILQSFTVLGQIKGACFEHFDPLSYGVGDQITFLDSTFEYKFVEGLVRGVVKGDYSTSGDTVTISSEFQEGDYTLNNFKSPKIPDGTVRLQIKQLEHSQVVDVSYLCIDDSMKFITGKTIRGSKEINLNNEPDTVIVEYIITLSDMKLDEIDATIWRKNNKITIELEKQNNFYVLDLTQYPNDLDYRFFNNKKLVIKKDKLYFLDELNNLEKDYYPIKTRKGITISKNKKIKEYKKCP